MIRSVDIDLNYQDYIPGPPESPEQLYNRACSNDGVTINAWRRIWLDNIKKNHDKYGPFKDNGIGKLYNKFLRQPVIVAGSGPSLSLNKSDLKDTKGIPIISCLHNFHFMEDNGIKVDYYVSLDAGQVTVDEISEGGEKSLDEYLEITKDRTLCCFIGSSPKLLEVWKGKVIWFNAPIPEKEIYDEIDKIERFSTYVSNGGNVLGACFYIAKAIMGANPIVFVGADFSFSYANKFHGWDSKYDANLGNVVFAHDVFGNRVKTWQSYYNFKCWFDSKACSVPGIYINATEGGILGAYTQGNIQQIRQMALSDVIDMYSLHSAVKASCDDPGIEEKLILF